MNYDRQMKAWAIDRAIETIKLKSEHPNGVSAEQVIENAEKYCAWVLESPAEEDVGNDNAQGNA